MGFGVLPRPSGRDFHKNHTCMATVDVAPGESLWVSLVSGQVPPPDGGYEAVCRQTLAATDTILLGLLARPS